MKNIGNVFADPKANVVLLDANNEVLAKEVLTEVFALPEELFEGKYSFNLKYSGAKINKPLTAIITLESNDDDILTREFKID